MKKLRIFISYAHADEDVKDLFIRHLNNPARNRGWELWDDTQIKAGEVRDDVIREELKKADALVLLVTVDFLNSEYVQKLDLFSEQNKLSARSGLVIPVKVAPCYVDNYLDISKLHWVNLYDPKEAAPGQKTLQNAQTPQEKSDVTAGGIREVIEALDAYAQAQAGGFSASRAETMDAAENAALKPLRDQEPGALLIAVERNKTVFLLPPGS
jgi:TIR domain